MISTNRSGLRDIGVDLLLVERVGGGKEAEDHSSKLGDVQPGETVRVTRLIHHSFMS